MGDETQKARAEWAMFTGHETAAFEAGLKLGATNATRVAVAKLRHVHTLDVYGGSLTREERCLLEDAAAWLEAGDHG